MTDPDELDADRLAVSGSSAFLRRIVELAPNVVLEYDATSWADAIVFVLAGEIELECSSGDQHRFSRGAILCFAPLPVIEVRNAGTAPARLLAISRRAPQPTVNTG
jgi:glyoxylate utilization-related uncharacterized protein